MSFSSILCSHEALSRRRKNSLECLANVKIEAQKEIFFEESSVTIFCAGSLARLEVGEKSDLDLFVIADNDPKLESQLYEYTLFAHLIHLNKEMGFPPFSNDGEYLKIHFIEDLKNRTGSRRDDSENLFTVRMLLMLESRPLIQEEQYYRHLASILEHYYRDEKGKKSFRPLFLLNDLLRYWRTLCLNYEERRHDPVRPWRKKNVNLKFSRMMTVFATVLPLVAAPISSAKEFEKYCKLSPLERLAAGLDLLNDDDLMAEWPVILDIYECFLTWKEDDNIEKYLEGGIQQTTVAAHANQFAAYLYKALTHKNIPEEYRRYLVL
jgi:predicted nucleotidyltransferase